MRVIERLSDLGAADQEDRRGAGERCPNERDVTCRDGSTAEGHAPQDPRVPVAQGDNLGERSHDLDGDRRLDMQRELVVVARCSELDVIPALADAAELVGIPTLVDLTKRVCDVAHVGEKAFVPLYIVPAEDYASVALFEEIRLAARAHKG